MKAAALSFLLALTPSALAQAGYGDEWSTNPWAVPVDSLAAMYTTVTSKIRTTVTVCPCATPTTTIASAPVYSISGGADSGSSKSSAWTDVTKTVASYTTVCPVTETYTSAGSTITKVYTTTSTLYSTATISASQFSSSSDYDVTKTVVSSLYTTLCPVTKTITSAGSTFTSTYSSTSVSTWKSTISAPVSSVSLTTLTSYSTYTSLVTATVSGSTTVKTRIHASPILYTSTCTESESAPYPTTEKSEGLSSSETGFSVTLSGTGSVSKVSGTGSVSKVSGTGSVSKVSGTGSSSKATRTRTASKSSGTGSVSKVSGTGSSKPSGTAFSTGSKSLSTGVSKTSSASPTSTAECKRCEGNPSDGEWCGYDASTNVEKPGNVPNTCVTREYSIVISAGDVSGDGIARGGIQCNGVFGCPLIEANWGDWISLTVRNELNNGTAVHFHGIRQTGTPEMDGVPSITQCPLAPGETFTYLFRADTYGTSWYHGHFGRQTYDGLRGPVIIHGPVQPEVSYDDEELLLLQDWSHVPIDDLFIPSQSVPVGGGIGGPPVLDTGLINGVNVWGADGSASQSGSRYELKVKKGSVYRLRLINAAFSSSFKFSIDGHKLKVIAMDFTPIVPYETSVISINIGERYDVVVAFDEAVGNYWLRSDNQKTCATLTGGQGNIKGIVRYEGASESALPTSTAYTYVDDCVDEPMASLVPYVAIDVGSSDQQVKETALIGPQGNLFKWTLSGTTFQSMYGVPTLLQAAKDGTVPTFSGNLAIEVPNLDEWVYLVIDTPIPVSHPIHLHQMSSYLLAQGLGLYNPLTVKLNLKNPPRRDVVQMPANGRLGQGGYVVIAFKAEAPTVALTHCHIGSHISMGFALQFIVGLDKISSTINSTNIAKMDATCAAWNTFANANNIFAAPNESGV